MDTLTPLRPSLCLLPYDLREVVEEVRAEHFPDVGGPVPIFITEKAPLACVETGRMDDRRARAIFLHSLLNDPGTPREVMVAIAKHELLHFVVPARSVGRRMTAHPPEFWERERELAPEMPQVWGWVWACLGPCLREDVRAGSVHVRRSWRKTRLAPRLSWSAITVDGLERRTPGAARPGWPDRWLSRAEAPGPNWSVFPADSRSLGGG